MHLQAIEMLLGLWVLPILAGVYLYAGHSRRTALLRFAAAGLVPRLNPYVSVARRRWKAALVLGAFALGVFALARPAWNPVPQTLERQGRDVVFVLDVSRSMLAEDLRPNRLERAKLAILDTVGRLAGDRVALIAFAGSAVVKCPLTLDYGFFRLMLEDVGRRSVTRGGTLIGDALRKATTAVFDDQEKAFKDVILITDGEDHDSFPVEAARDLGARGVRLIAIGIGDEHRGTPIPITGEDGTQRLLTHQGKEVRSRLDADTLRTMVNATPGGRYLNVATGTIDLGAVYSKLVRGAERKELESETVTRYEEKFQIFAAAALLLLAIEMCFGERRRPPNPDASAPVSVSGAAALLLTAALICVAGPARADEAAEAVEAGNAAFAAEAYEDALAAYEQASVAAPESAVIRFNCGTVYYRLGDYSKAREQFQAAAERAREPALEARARYNLGNCAWQEGQRQRDSDLQKCLAALQEAAAFYQQALRLDATLEAAARNLEVTRLTIKQILDEIKKRQEEAAKQQQQQEEQLERLQKLIQEQEALRQESVAKGRQARNPPASGDSSGDNSTGATPAQKPPPGPSGAPTPETPQDKEAEPSAEEGNGAAAGGALAERQQGLRERTGALAQDLTPPAPGAGATPTPQGHSGQEAARQALAAAQGKQGSAVRQLESSVYDGAAADQAAARQHLEDALAALQQQQQSQQQQQQGEDGESEQEQEQEQQGAEPPPEDPADQEQQEDGSAGGQAPERAPAAPLDEAAQDILDQEKENREDALPAVIRGAVPVEKDW